MANYLQLKPKKQHSHGHSHANGGGCSHDHGEHTNHSHTHAHDEHDAVPAVGDKSAVPSNASVLKLTLTAMDCPTEANLIRQAFAQNEQIHLLEFDLINRVLTVTHTLDDEQDIHRKLIDIDLLDDPSKSTSHSPQIEWAMFAASGVLALSSELLDWSGANTYVVAITALLAVALAGTSTLKKGWTALRHFNLNINLLMSVAVIGALLIGQFPEAAVVIFLFTLAEKIEAASLDRARNAISALQAHAPESALVRQENGTWQLSPSNQINVGQIVRARPGERIALDGIVSSGTSSVNQAPITGESMPVFKNKGDAVFAGSLNEDGSLEYQVTAAAGSTTLDRIATAIQQAQQQRAPTERMIDRFAKIYTPCVFMAALLMATVPPLLFAASWHDSIYKALVLLVIACPCALVISTPVTVVSALTSAARRGILVKGGQYLEQARHLKTIAFDKTGTLTIGKPVLNNIIPLANLDQAMCLQLAASLNSLSQHPIANAIVEAHKKQARRVDYVSNFKSLTGRGVMGDILNETHPISYVLGNVLLMAETKVKLTTAQISQIEQLESKGNTVVILAHAQHQIALALFSVADQVRENSQATISQLRSLGINTAMLTGDNGRTAETVGQEVGITKIYSCLLPEDKQKHIAELQELGPVAMLGDGVNDAPALARADIGMTLGAAASATALETADVAFMQDDLSKIAELIALSKRCSKVLIQNISIALGIKICFFALTLLGYSNLWMAVFADMGASLIVIFNGLRLLKQD